MTKLPKRKLFKRVLDVAVAAGIILLIKGEETAQALKKKAEIFSAKRT